jgi:DNA topoisomerase 2-associated protein PAT1
MVELWKQLHLVTSTVSEEETKTAAKFLVQAPPIESVSLLASHSKGRRVIPKLLAVLPKDQALLLLKSTVAGLRNVILRSKEPALVVKELEEYSSFVVLAFLPLISSCPIKVVQGLISTEIDSDGILSLTKSKPGILVLTLIISRAELLKHGGDIVTDEDIKRWDETLFPKFFDILKGRFATLFPPSHILPSMFSQSSSAFIVPQTVQVDDTYVWNFLAAVAASATIDHHRVLVAEVRDKIFEVLNSQGADGKKKVNLFLNALGLDASQLME